MTNHLHPAGRAQQDTSSGSKQLPTDDPRLAPSTDPTNPYHQEAVGVNVAGQRCNERKVDEPGLTEEDRALRGPTY